MTARPVLDHSPSRRQPWHPICPLHQSPSHLPEAKGGRSSISTVVLSLGRGTGSCEHLANAKPFLCPHIARYVFGSRLAASTPLLRHGFLVPVCLPARSLLFSPVIRPDRQLSASRATFWLCICAMCSTVEFYSMTETTRCYHNSNEDLGEKNHRQQVQAH